MRQMKKLVTVLLLLLPCFMLVSCTEPKSFFALEYPLTSAKLKADKSKLKTNNLGRTLKISGNAKRKGDEDWKLSLTLEGLESASIVNVAIQDEPNDSLSLATNAGKCVVTWEVSPDRWLKKTPFVLSLSIDDGREITLTVVYPAKEYETTLFGKTAATGVTLILVCLLYYGIPIWVIFL